MRTTIRPRAPIGADYSDGGLLRPDDPGERVGDVVERVVIVSREPVHLKISRCRVLVAGLLSSHETLSLILWNKSILTYYLQSTFYQIN